MTLKELEIGDRFVAKAAWRKRSPVYSVLEKCQFNLGHGTSTRQCLNLLSNKVESKSCRLEVIKFKEVVRN